MYGKCLLFIIMMTCPTCGRKVLSHACYVQCRSCCEYYHMKCISLEKNMQDDIHNSKCDWLCSNCLADIFPFNQIEDDNEIIDECQLRMKASLKKFRSYLQPLWIQFLKWPFMFRFWPRNQFLCKRKFVQWILMSISSWGSIQWKTEFIAYWQWSESFNVPN